ncbi:hypothetical protein KIPB_001833 [Kipferlia bialata]|uniref:Carboxypeptidase regulatory-like domain-containing protein n=1 Tax=Kipferlia bialata TaxID=797122 RepID=A0A9K3CRJ0_9EUKA|nr:hypothetical protein KIPB_001833 [Kipferlia bialata]|eukprot:g1833.t1
MQSLLLLLLLALIAASRGIPTDTVRTTGEGFQYYEASIWDTDTTNIPTPFQTGVCMCLTPFETLVDGITGSSCNYNAALCINGPDNEGVYTVEMELSLGKKENRCGLSHLTLVTVDPIIGNGYACADNNPIRGNSSDRRYLRDIDREAFDEGFKLESDIPGCISDFETGFETVFIDFTLTSLDDVIVMVKTGWGTESFQFEGLEELCGGTCTAEVEGTVTDTLGNPLEGVTVDIDAPGVPSTETDSQGQYSFSDIPLGTHTLTYTPPPGSTCQSTTREVHVPECETYTVDVELFCVPCTAEVEGTVTDTLGTPLEGVIVEITAIVPIAVTDSNGHYTLSGVPPGPHILSLFPGPNTTCQPTTVELVVPDCDPITVDVEMCCGGGGGGCDDCPSMCTVVSDMCGLVLDAFDMRFSVHRPTNSTGVACFGCLAEGDEVMLSWDESNGYAAGEECLIWEVTNTPVPITVECTDTLSLLVSVTYSDPFPGPVEGADVRWQLLADPGTGQTLVTDETGQVLFDSLGAVGYEDYVVIISAPGVGAELGPFTFPCCGQVPLQVELPCGRQEVCVSLSPDCTSSNPTYIGGVLVEYYSEEGQFLGSTETVPSLPAECLSIEPVTTVTARFTLDGEEFEEELFLRCGENQICLDIGCVSVLAGFTIDQSTQGPVSNVVVSVGDPTLALTVSDADGYYEIGHIPPEVYDVLYSAPTPYRAESRVVDLTSCDTTQLDLELVALDCRPVECLCTSDVLLLTDETGEVVCEYQAQIVCVSGPDTEGRYQVQLVISRDVVGPESCGLQHLTVLTELDVMEITSTDPACTDTNPIDGSNPDSLYLESIGLSQFQFGFSLQSLLETDPACISDFLVIPESQTISFTTTSLETVLILVATDSYELTAFAAFGCTGCDDRVLTGRVFDATTGDGIPGVAVELDGNLTVSDEEGFYQLPDPNPGQGIVHVVPPEPYTPEEVEVFIEECGETFLDIALQGGASECICTYQQVAFVDERHGTAPCVYFASICVSAVDGGEYEVEMELLSEFTPPECILSHLTIVSVDPVLFTPTDPLCTDCNPIDGTNPDSEYLIAIDRTQFQEGFRLNPEPEGCVEDFTQMPEDPQVQTVSFSAFSLQDIIVMVNRGDDINAYQSIQVNLSCSCGDRVLSGIVRDAETGEGIHEVQVELEGDVTSTDPEGFYQFFDPLPGPSLLQFFPPAPYLPLELPVDINECGETIVDAFLEPGCDDRVLTGRVVDDDTDIGIEGVFIGVSGVGNTVTDEDGQYTIPSPNPGLVTIELAPPAPYNPIGYNAIINECGVTVQDIPLSSDDQCERVLLGMVSDAQTGVGVGGVDVLVEPTQDNTQTDASGLYSVPFLWAGFNLVTFTPPLPYGPQTLGITIPTCGPFLLDVGLEELCEPRTLLGVVFDEETLVGIEGVVVELEGGDTTVTEENGDYFIDNPNPDDAIVHFTPPLPYQPLSLDIAISECGQTKVDVGLSAA